MTASRPSMADIDYAANHFGSRLDTDAKAHGTPRVKRARHPVPARLIDGLSVRMMIVSRRFRDAAVRRVGNAFESLLAGFRPPREEE